MNNNGITGNNTTGGASQQAQFPELPPLVRVRPAPGQMHEIGYSRSNSPSSTPLPTPTGEVPQAEGAWNAAQHAFGQGQESAGTATTSPADVPSTSRNAIDQTIDEVVQTAAASGTDVPSTSRNAIDQTIDEVIQAAREYYKR